MSNIFENKGAFGTTIVVAASNSLKKRSANYVCDGTDDQVEIQAAIDALPSTGGKVVLLDGTYYVEASLVLDSYQTLRGCGRNTILTTTTADLNIITATGGAGTEKVGILIADLCIDGDAGAAVNDIGIRWEYVDRSRIESCWIRDNGEDGIYLVNCDNNILVNNVSISNTQSGIEIASGTQNIIIGNILTPNTGTNLVDSGTNTEIGHNITV